MSRTAPDDIIKPVPPELMIVRAGAGAGKTTELVTRVLALALFFLETKKRLPHLVVTTFTRKATQELKERLLQKSLETKNPDLIRFVQSPSHLHISTIHGVLSLYLVRYGAKIGLGPQFSIMKSETETKLIKKSFRQMMKQENHRRVLDLLLEDSSLSTIIDSVKNYLDQRFLHQEPIPFFTQDEVKIKTSEFALGWAEKAEELLGHVESTQTGKNWPEYIALLRLTLEKTRQSRGTDLSSIYHFSESRPTASLKGTSEEIKELKSEVQGLSDDLYEKQWILSKEALNRHQELALGLQSVSELVFQNLCQQKMSSGMLTMSDLENFSLWLARDFPQTAESFSKEWDYWLLDEYQDTSPKQVKILEQLIGSQNSFTVGDPQQSIYLFRGARAEVFLQKEKEIKEAGGELREKMENYRSRPELLHFFNHFFQSYDSSQFHPMKTTSEKTHDQPCAYYIQANEEVPMGDYLSALERIHLLLSESVAPEEICILARSNRVLQEFAHLCYQHSVPVQLHSGSGYRGRREILDALMILKFLINPHDNVNLIGLLRSPWFRVLDRDLAQITTENGDSYWISLQNKFEGHFVTKMLLGIKKQADELGFVLSWRNTMINCGLLDSCAKLDPSGRREANLMKLISELHQKERLPGFRILDFIYESENLDTEGVGDSDAVPVISLNRVNLMTVHASKGLQFQHVILIGVGAKAPSTRSAFWMYHEQDQKFTLSLIDPASGKMQVTPHGEEIRTTKSDREKQEMGRVLYVALTRAKHSICLTWQKSQKSSWASQMWQPKTGIQNHENFRTSYLAEHRPHVLSFASAEKVTEKLPEKLNLHFSKSEQTKSITEILSMANATAGKNQAKKRVEIAQRGVEIHRLFESLRYRSELPPAETHFERSVHEFLLTEQGKQVRAWIQNGFVEWGFCVLEKNIWFQGQIDLWTRTDSGEVFVVDYKTGSKDYLEKAKEQLNLYAWALRKMGKVTKMDLVKIAVVYPMEKDIWIGVADPDYIPGPLRTISPSH